MAELSRLCSKSKPQDAASTSAMPDSIILLLDGCGSLLAYDDSSAVKVFSDHADLLNTAFPDHYSSLENAVNMFRFPDPPGIMNGTLAGCFDL